MATRNWIVRPGGALVRRTKSRTDQRPGRGTSRRFAPPRWWRTVVHRQERRRARRALFRGADHTGPFRRKDYVL